MQASLRSQRTSHREDDLGSQHHRTSLDFVFLTAGLNIGLLMGTINLMKAMHTLIRDKTLKDVTLASDVDRLGDIFAGFFGVIILLSYLPLAIFRVMDKKQSSKTTTALLVSQKIVS